VEVKAFTCGEAHGVWTNQPVKMPVPAPKKKEIVVNACKGIYKLGMIMHTHHQAEKQPTIWNPPCVIASRQARPADSENGPTK
jgi:hypothetical protein